MRHAEIPEAVAVKAANTRALIAANFSEELKAQRWSKRSASVALGLSHTYVNNRANGDVEMSGSDIAMFAEFLNVPVTRFYQVGPEVTTSVAVKAIDTSRNANRPPLDYSTDVPRPIVRLFNAS